jgi:Chaperone of endosialidase
LYYNYYMKIKVKLSINQFIPNRHMGLFALLFLIGGCFESTTDNTTSTSTELLGPEPDPYIASGEIIENQLVLKGIGLSKIKELRVVNPNTDARFEVVLSSDNEITAFALAPVFFSLGSIYSLALESASASTVYPIKIGTSKMEGNLVVGVPSTSYTYPEKNTLQIHGAAGTDDYFSAGEFNLQLRIINGKGVQASRAMDIGVLDNGTGVIQMNERNFTTNDLYINPMGGRVAIGSNSVSAMVSPTPTGHLTVAHPNKVSVVLDSSGSTLVADDGPELIWRGEGGASNKSVFAIKNSFVSSLAGNKVHFQHRNNYSPSLGIFDSVKNLMTMDLGNDKIGILNSSPTEYLTIGESTLSSTVFSVTGAVPSTSPSPTVALFINTSTGSAATFTNTSTGSAATFTNNSAGSAAATFTNTSTGSAATFTNNSAGSAAATFTNSGTGTAVSITGTSASPTPLVVINNGAGSGAALTVTGPATQIAQFISTGATTTCTLSSSSPATISCSSDERLKKDIHALNGEEALAKILELQPVTFRWKKGDDSEPQAGFIAQHVMEVLPRLVTKGQDGYLSLGATGMIPYVVESIKELHQMIKNLSALAPEIKSLQEQNQQLQTKIQTLEERLVKLEKAPRK